MICRNVQAVKLLLHFKASTCTPIYTSSGRYMAPVNKAVRLMAEEDSAGSGILIALLEVRVGGCKQVTLRWQ